VVYFNYYGKYEIDKTALNPQREWEMWGGGDSVWLETESYVFKRLLAVIKKSSTNFN